MSEMCCTRLAENTGRKNRQKNRHLGTIAQLCLAVSLSSQLRHVLTNGKKNMLNNNISSTCLRNMVNFHPLTDEIFWRVWGNRSKFQPVSHLAFRYCTDVAQRRSTKLCRMFGRLLDWNIIYTFLGFLPPNGIFASCKINFASKSCVLQY